MPNRFHISFHFKSPDMDFNQEVRCLLDPVNLKQTMYVDCLLCEIMLYSDDVVSCALGEKMPFYFNSSRLTKHAYPLLPNLLGPLPSACLASEVMRSSPQLSQ